MTPEQKKVRDFHEMVDMLICKKPTNPSGGMRLFKVKTIQKKLDKLKNAFQVNDLIEMADALGDLLYIVYGVGVSLGIDLEPVFNEVHRSNMTKKDGFNSDDQIYTNLESIIEEQLK